GTVVKFPAYPGTLARVTILGPMECRTSHYRPAIFTSDFDNTVGESIERGVPVLTTDYGGTQLRFYDTGVPILLQHLRLRHGYSGILFEGNNPDNTVRHCQFVHCRYPVQNTSDSIVRLQNVLIDAVKSLGFAFSEIGRAHV